MEKIEVVLTNCINEIRSGQATLAECLSRYPSHRELEPLLKMALNIQEPPSTTLDSGYKQMAKTQLLQQIKTTRQKKSHPLADIFSFGLPPQMVWARVAAAVIIGVIIMSMLGGGTAYAAQNSLPGELLYSVKTETENFRLMMAGNSADKAALNLEFAQTRLDEMGKLADRNPEKTGLAVNGYRGNLTAAGEQIHSITDVTILTRFLEKFSLHLQDQLLFCDNIIDAHPVYNGPVQEAISLAVNQQADTLNMLAQYDSTQAVLINLDIMKQRLHRAQAKASNNQYHLMQEAMLHYQQFNQLGRNILEAAQEKNKEILDVERLSSQALQNYIETLDIVIRQVPEEYTNVLETSQELTTQFQTQASYRYQNQGEPGHSPEVQPSGEHNAPAPGQEALTPPQHQNGPGGTGSEKPEATATSSPGSNGNSGNGDGTGSEDSSGYGEIPNPGTGNPSGSTDGHKSS